MLVRKSYLEKVVKAIVAHKLGNRYGFQDGLRIDARRKKEIPNNEDKYSRLAGGAAENAFKNTNKTLYQVKRENTPKNVRRTENSIFNKNSWRYMVTIKRLAKALSKEVGDFNTRMTYAEVVSSFSKIEEIKHQINLNMSRIRRML